MEKSSARSEQMAAVQKDHRFLRGRQIAFLIYEYFQVTRTHEAALDFSDLFSVTQRGDDVEGFDTGWDEVLLSTHEVPSDAILESLYKMQIRESDQFKTVLAFLNKILNRRTHNRATTSSKTMVKKFLD